MTQMMDTGTESYSSLMTSRCLESMELVSFLCSINIIYSVPHLPVSSRHLHTSFTLSRVNWSPDYRSHSIYVTDQTVKNSIYVRNQTVKKVCRALLK